MSDLLEVVKNNLDITWDDEYTNKKILEFIKMGMSYLSDKYGSEVDFEKNLEGRQLLLDYCRFARSNALEEFEMCFLSQLMNFSIKGALENGNV